MLSRTIVSLKTKDRSFHQLVIHLDKIWVFLQNTCVFIPLANLVYQLHELDAITDTLVGRGRTNTDNVGIQKVFVSTQDVPHGGRDFIRLCASLSKVIILCCLVLWGSWLLDLRISDRISLIRKHHQLGLNLSFLIFFLNFI